MKKFYSTEQHKLPVLAFLALSGSLAQAQISSVVNAASFIKNAGLTPGSIITIKGTNLTNATAQAPNPSSLPKSIAGVTVTIGGVPSSLFYVSPTQVNAQIDPTVTVGMRPLVLTSPTGTFNSQVLVETAGVPGIFSLSGSGTRDGAILNAVTFALGPFSVTTGGAPTYLALYTTGLDLSSAPKVTFDGIEVPVQFYGNAPGFVGLQQINVQLLPSLAGAGRVEVAVKTGSKTSNIVETVILPNVGQVSFAPDEEHQQRSREIASMAYVPGTSRILLTDENDDVVRVIDVKEKKVIRTITLPEGAEPSGLAVNSTGALALVAERERGKVALLDLAANTVLQEITVGQGPTAVAIAGNIGVVVNQDTDTVSLINLTTKLVTNTVNVGRGPRGVAVDTTNNRAFVINQADGTVSVINLLTGVVSNTFNLGADSRPAAIQILPTLGVGAVTEPSSHNEGKVVLFNLTSGAVLASINVNPDKSGGSGDIAIYNNTVYFANQAGGSISIAPVTMVGPLPTFTLTTLKVGLGARSLVVDTLDKILLVTNQGSGNIVCIDLNNNQVIGRINAVRSENENENDKNDNREDREKSPNLPTLTSVAPAAGLPSTTFTLTIVGTNLTGATDVVFIDPDTVPGKGKDKSKGKGNSGNKGHGPFGKRDTAFTASNIQVNAAGTQLTATIAVAANASKGDHVVRVLTPNGESTFEISSKNTFKVN